MIYSTSERPPRPDKPGRIRRYRLGKGLALGTVSGADYLFATDLHNGKVDVFDTNFVKPAVMQGKFIDPTRRQRPVVQTFEGVLQSHQ